MTPLSIAVRIVADTDIEVALADMLRLAKQLRVCVEASFGGVRLVVVPTSDGKAIVAAYRADMLKRPARLFRSPSTWSPRCPQA